MEFEDLFGSSQELIQSPSPLTPPPTLNRPTAPSRKRIRIESDRSLPILSSPLISSQSVVSQIYSNNQPHQNLDSMNINRTIEPTEVNATNTVNTANPNSNTTVNSLNVEQSPILASFKTIMSRYLNSDIVINSLFQKIASIPDGEFILFNKLIRTINTSLRPSANIRQQIIEELHEAGIIKFSTGLRNTSIKIEKGALFEL